VLPTPDSEDPHTPGTEATAPHRAGTGLPSRPGPFLPRLGTGLRLRELQGLNVGDVTQDRRTIQWRVPLDPKITKGGRGGTAFLVAGVRREVRRLLSWKGRVGEPLDPGSPLFRSRHGRRVSLRRIQFVFREWQALAGFETIYPFHTSATRPSRTSTAPRRTSTRDALNPPEIHVGLLAFSPVRDYLNSAPVGCPPIADSYPPHWMTPGLQRAPLHRTPTA